MEKRYNAYLDKNDSFVAIHHSSSFSFPKLPVISSENPNTFLNMQWGLIPNWISDDTAAAEIRMKTFNARSETIIEKASFKQAFQSKRCLVPATGFYEWRTYNGKKYPYYITVKGEELFSFAGIYDEWENGSDEVIRTFSIVTTEANPLMEMIHNTKKRMPVILPKNEEKLWLENTVAPNELLQLLQPFNENLMEAHTISRLITDRTKDSNVPEVEAPYDYQELSYQQTSLF